jgi:hypothetical protein
MTPEEHTAPVQATYMPRNRTRPPGVISWAEHEEAWREYAERFGKNQSAERIAERGGFSYGELQMFLGRQPATWRPR